jgi:hypothetical protein
MMKNKMDWWFSFITVSLIVILIGVVIFQDWNLKNQYSPIPIQEKLFIISIDQRKEYGAEGHIWLLQYAIDGVTHQAIFSTSHDAQYYIEYLKDGRELWMNTADKTEE